MKSRMKAIKDIKLASIDREEDRSEKIAERMAKTMITESREELLTPFQEYYNAAVKLDKAIIAKFGDESSTINVESGLDECIFTDSVKDYVLEKMGIKFAEHKKAVVEIYTKYLVKLYDMDKKGNGEELFKCFKEEMEAVI